MEETKLNFSNFKWIRLILHSLLLFVGWIVLSGFYDAFHLGLGVISVACVIFLNRRGYFYSTGREAKTFFIGRVIFYHLWMFKEMLLSALFVVRCVLSPKMPIQPCLFRFKSEQPNDLAKVVLGNSITLTPGTLTVDLEGENFLIHALSKETAEGLLEGTMPRTVAKLFTNQPGSMVSNFHHEKVQGSFERE